MARVFRKDQRSSFNDVVSTFATGASVNQGLLVNIVKAHTSLAHLRHV